VIRARLLASSLFAVATACAVEYTVPFDGAAPMCEPGLLACGGDCFDPTMSALHCGECDRACASDEACMQGECTAQCPAGESVCDQLCIDISSDPAHCGLCFNDCDAEEVCIDGDCIEACEDSCDDDVQLCVDGECTCRDGFVPCGSTCVDTSNDPNHCGMCDRGCEGQPCGDGECQPDDCPGFPDLCDSSCTDVQTDPLHCGGCDRECHPSQDCVGAQCVPGGGA
jgi:hypothetical protein